MKHKKIFEKDAMVRNIILLLVFLTTYVLTLTRASWPVIVYVLLYSIPIIILVIHMSYMAKQKKQSVSFRLEYEKYCKQYIYPYERMMVSIGFLLQMICFWWIMR